MQRAIIFIITATLLFSAPITIAKTLYTWTDENGVVHITETKPPAGSQQTDKVTYKPKPKKETSDIEKHKANERRAWLLEIDARRKAQRLRREADIAKKEMDAAIEEANRIKDETDEYIRQWGGWSRDRKSIHAKINRKKEATNQAVADADRLRTIANEAEAKAQAAEKELDDLTQLSRESKDYTRNLEAETPSPSE
jgi:chromosome segregation ATPase